MHHHHHNDTHHPNQRYHNANRTNRQTIAAPLSPQPEEKDAIVSSSRSPSSIQIDHNNSSSSSTADHNKDTSNSIRKDTSKSSKDDGPLPNGLEHGLIGLSPEYWCYVPLFVVDVRSLLLIDGLAHCLVVPSSSTTTKTNTDIITSTNPSPTSPPSPKPPTTTTTTPSPPIIIAERIVPLSKCTLVGILTYVHVRSDCSTRYILDDGTGSIDCVFWNSNEKDGDGSIVFPKRYRLSFASLTSGDGLGSVVGGRRRIVTGWEAGGCDDVGVEGGRREVRVGDLVRILGWMKCVAPPPSSSLPSTEDNDASVFPSSSSVSSRIVSVGIDQVRCGNGTAGDDKGRTDTPMTPSSKRTVWEARRCVREIHVHKIRRLGSTMTSTDHRRHQFAHPPFDEETVHWLECLTFLRRLRNERVFPNDNNSNIDDDDDTERERLGENNTKGGKRNRDGGGSNDGEDLTYRLRCRLIQTPIYDGADILRCVAPSMIRSSSTLYPSSTNTNTNTNTNVDGGGNGTYIDIARHAYFDRHCTCGGSTLSSSSNGATAYATTFSAIERRRALWYCHCLATDEPLDPDLMFRDALLDRLLGMEQRLVEDMTEANTKCTSTTILKTTAEAVARPLKRRLDDNDNSDDNSKGDDDDDDDCNGVFHHQQQVTTANVNDPVTTEPTITEPFGLKFLYRSVANDPYLLSLASRCINHNNNNTSNDNNNTTSSFIRRLYTNTFHRLRDDGILYLIDVNEDAYLLLSVERVLLPAMRMLMTREEKEEGEERREKKTVPLSWMHPFWKVVSDTKFRVIRDLVVREWRRERR